MTDDMASPLIFKLDARISPAVTWLLAFTVILSRYAPSSAGYLAGWLMSVGVYFRTRKDGPWVRAGYAIDPMCLDALLKRRRRPR